MNSRSKKKQDCGDKHGNCKDRLSELPDEILVHILSFLPIEDAVRTVLLRRFGKLWTLLPTLNFYISEEKLVCKVMKYHKCPTIDKLEFFRIWPFNKDVIKWINFALRKKAKILRIYGDTEPTDLILPPNVFSNQYLVSIRLTGFEIELPRRVYMPSLRKLVLAFVTMSNETFKDMISGCPCLQELMVIFPYELKELHFTAPSIEKLELDFNIDYDSAKDRYYSLDCPNLKILHIEDVYVPNLELIDVSSVREAKICNGTTFGEDETVDHFEVFVDKFRNAEVFELYEKASLQIEHCGNVKLASQKKFTTHLVLRSGIRGSCLLGICRLLRNSWYLQELIIYANVDIFCDCNMLLRELSSPCVMPQLKIVTIRDYEKPSLALLQLIEFLLKSAVVLDNLVILCNRKDRLPSVEGNEFMMELLSFPRASRNARVVFA